jgi:hypothetical protein
MYWLGKIPHGRNAGERAHWSNQITPDDRFRHDELETHSVLSCTTTVESDCCLPQYGRTSLLPSNCANRILRYTRNDASPTLQSITRRETTLLRKTARSTQCARNALTYLAAMPICHSRCGRCSRHSWTGCVAQPEPSVQCAGAALLLQSALLRTVDKPHRCNQLQLPSRPRAWCQQTPHQEPLSLRMGSTLASHVSDVIHKSYRREHGGGREAQGQEEPQCETILATYQIRDIVGSRLSKFLNHVPGTRTVQVPRTKC